MKSKEKMRINLGDREKGLHHAYCIEGERAAAYEGLVSYLHDNYKINSIGNPDFSYLEFDTLPIEETRLLKGKEKNRSISGQKKIFILSANFITREAQNSLLKIFEEPTEDTHFFILLSSAQILIPTLKSRMQIVKVDSSNLKSDSSLQKEVENFVKSLKSERLAMLKKIIDEKDKQKAIEFINELEACLWKKADIKKMGEEQVKFFEDIIKMKQYMADRGSNVKMIMEYIALSMD